METKESQIRKLANAVAEARSQGVVKQWSPEIQKAALMLAEKYGIYFISKAVKIHAVSIYNWKKEALQSKEKQPDFVLKDQIAVTRVTSVSQTVHSEQKVKIEVERGELKLKIFCLQIAEKFLEKVSS